LYQIAGMKQEVTADDSVFISYARLDQDFVLQLAQALKERGLSVWVDKWNISVGADWNRAIDDAIRNCKRFLIVLSPAATVSEDAGEVGGELQLALNLHKEIVPVLYQACDIPRQLLRLEYIDLSSGLNEASIDLLAPRRPGETAPEVPCDRLKFIDKLQCYPKDDRAFDDEFSHTMALELSKRLSDAQFKALRDLKAMRDRYGYDPPGIVESEILERIEGPRWEARRVFDALFQFGFFALSTAPRERNRPDTGYDYTPLFFGYTNLQAYLGFGEPSKQLTEPLKPPEPSAGIGENRTQVIMGGVPPLRKRTPSTSGC
jgi:TIR domain